MYRKILHGISAYVTPIAIYGTQEVDKSRSKCEETLYQSSCKNNVPSIKAFLPIEADKSGKFTLNYYRTVNRK